MPCKPDKDLTRIKASCKVYPLGGRHFYAVYLWETKEAMYAASVDDVSGCGAFTSHMPHVINVDTGALKFYPKVGELHFYAGNWDQEVVAHECLHASIQLARAYGLTPEKIFDGSGELSQHLECPESIADGESLISDEEIFCYIHGELFNAVYRWLWGEK